MSDKPIPERWRHIYKNDDYDEFTTSTTDAMIEEIGAAEDALSEAKDTLEYSNRIRREAEDMAGGYADALKAAKAQVAQLQADLAALREAKK